MENCFAGIHRRICNTSSPLMLQVSSAPIGYVSKGVTLGIFVLVAFVTITEHTYMNFEDAVAVTNVYVAGAGFKAAMAANATPGYCSSAEYQYRYSPTWNYVPDGCRATAGAYPEVFSKSPGQASFVTFYQEYELEQSGAYSPERVTSQFFPHVEELEMFFDHSVTGISAGVKATNVETTLRGVGGSMHFSKGETPHGKISEFFALAGLHIDDENKDSGGAGLSVGGNQYWPRYRLTGAALQFEMVYANTKSARPFDFTPHLVIEVSIASEQSWNSKGPRVMTLPQTDGRWKMVERYEYAVSFFFKTSGSFGVPSLFSGVYSFLLIMAGYAMAVLIAEVMCHCYIKQYANMKNFTENNWTSLTYLTYKSFNSGELQRAAMALGVEPERPGDPESAIAAFEQAAAGGSPGVTRIGSFRSSNKVYFGNM